jgi:hypothetical protein
MLKDNVTRHKQMDKKIKLEERNIKKGFTKRMDLNKKRKHEYKKMYKDRNNNYDCEHLTSLLGAYFSCLLVLFIDCPFFQFTASTSIILR